MPAHTQIKRELEFLLVPYNETLNIENISCRHIGYFYEWSIKSSLHHFVYITYYMHSKIFGIDIAFLNLDRIRINSNLVAFEVRVN